MQTRESLAIFVFVLLQHYIGIATASILEPGFSRTAILVDPFTEYLSGHCKEYCAARDIRVVEVVSGFTAGALEAKGVSIPAKFLAPTAGFESSWAEEFAIDVQNCPPDVICVVAESDAGVPTAERIAVALNLPGNGISPQLRNKFMTNERARSVGLKVVEQALVSKWDDAHSFVEDLLRKSPYGACVIKPYRGVASDGVYLCRTIQEAKFAFESLHGQPQFGGGSNDAVLIQEYVAGTEYAVDTVARDGEIKVVALWRYRKLPFNGAPFVYQCSELVPCNGEEERAVCDYCVDILRAQGLKWGPTHTEIMASKDGPRLIEVNARFHAQHFQPIARACLGYDAIESTMDAYFDPDAFGAIPARPTELRSRGMIVHLISPVEGTVNRINHEEEIKSLPSFVCMHLEPGVGDAIVKTVNIRTDSGYVLLQHPDPEVVEADYRRVVELQSSIFEVETEGGVVDSYMGSLDDNNQAHSTGISFNQGVHNIDDFGHRQNENIENQSLSMPQQLSLSEKVKTAVKDNVDKILKDLKRVDVQSLIRSVATQIHRSNVGLTAVRSMRAIPFTVAKILGKAAVLVTLYALIAYSLAILSTSPPLKNLRL